MSRSNAADHRAEDQPPQSMAWLVKVNLAALAMSLERLYVKPFDEMAAAVWLTRDHSPFTQTDEWARFYIDEAGPDAYLNDDEIISVVATAKQHHATQRHRLRPDGKLREKHGKTQA